MEQNIKPTLAASQPETSPLSSPELAQSGLPAIPLQQVEKLQLLWGDLLQAAVREPGLFLMLTGVFTVTAWATVWPPCAVPQARLRARPHPYLSGLETTRLSGQ